MKEEIKDVNKLKEYMKKVEEVKEEIKEVKGEEGKKNIKEIKEGKEEIEEIKEVIKVAALEDAKEEIEKVEKVIKKEPKVEEIIQEKEIPEEDKMQKEENIMVIAGDQSPPEIEKELSKDSIPEDKPANKPLAEDAEAQIIAQIIQNDIIEIEQPIPSNKMSLDSPIVEQKLAVIKEEPKAEKKIVLSPAMVNAKPFVPSKAKPMYQYMANSKIEEQEKLRREKEAAQNKSEEKPKEKSAEELAKEKAEEEKEKKRIEEEEREKKRLEEERIEREREVCKVTAGRTIMETECVRYLYQVLENRLLDPTTRTLSNYVKKVLGKIYNRINNIHKKMEMHKTSIDLNLPESEFMSECELTLEGISSMSEEEFLGKILDLSSMDPKSVWELLESQGYDFWLDEVAYVSEEEMPPSLPIHHLENLRTMIEVDICKETKSVLALDPKSLRWPNLSVSKWADSEPSIQEENKEEDSQSLINPTPTPTLNTPPINHLSEQELAPHYPYFHNLNLKHLRYNFGLLKVFNNYLATAIPYINGSLCARSIPSHSIPLTISSYLSSTRGLCLHNTKIMLQQTVLEHTAIDRDRPPRLTFERLKLAYKPNVRGLTEGEGEGRPRGEESMFYRAYEQMGSLDPTLLRPARPQGSDPFLAFEIVFKGENVVGEGGPYRQFFADISSELQPSSSTGDAYTEREESSALRLLVQSPNTKNKIGEGRDRYVVNPSCTSPTQLALLEFLGVLMGCCMRTGVHLTLDLPSFVFKQIVAEKLTLTDLQNIDRSVCDLLKFMQGVTQEVFEGKIFETFSTYLSDESIKELIPDGSQRTVKFEERFEYIEKVLVARLSECSLQCQAIRKGFSQVVPLALLNILGWEEFETQVCGKPKVDVAMLKRRTKYSGNLSETSEVIKNFWIVLNELSEPDKLRFIKFCWGQERLPANDEEFNRHSTRFMIKPAMRRTGNPDQALPKADTCFFNLELPNYSSKQVIYMYIISLDTEGKAALGHSYRL